MPRSRTGKKKKKNYVNVIIIGILIAIIGVLSYKMFYENNNIKTIEKTVRLSFENIGELATESAYTTTVGSMSKSRGQSLGIEIPFTKSTIIYSYDYIIKAGIDFADVQAKVDDVNKIITISMPEFRILSNEIVLDSLKVYYENESLYTNISVDERNTEDLKLQAEAEQAAINNGILDKAKDNAEAVIKGFVANLYNLDEYDLIFVDNTSAVDDEQNS
ncbi:MAG: DUF4230 domain-containing protein [Eubacteriales bacterium]|nr:DUF4230 domain-containing protein [Eubacteriales bacterium]